MTNLCRAQAFLPFIFFAFLSSCNSSSSPLPHVSPFWQLSVLIPSPLECTSLSAIAQVTSSSSSLSHVFTSCSQGSFSLLHIEQPSSTLTTATATWTMTFIPAQCTRPVTAISIVSLAEIYFTCSSVYMLINVTTTVDLAAIYMPAGSCADESLFIYELFSPLRLHLMCYLFSPSSSFASMAVLTRLSISSPWSLCSVDVNVNITPSPSSSALASVSQFALDESRTELIVLLSSELVSYTRVSTRSKLWTPSVVSHAGAFVSSFIVANNFTELYTRGTTAYASTVYQFTRPTRSLPWMNATSTLITTSNTCGVEQISLVASVVLIISWNCDALYLYKREQALSSSPFQYKRDLFQETKAAGILCSTYSSAPFNFAVSSEVNALYFACDTDLALLSLQWPVGWSMNTVLVSALDVDSERGFGFMPYSSSEIAAVRVTGSSRRYFGHLLALQRVAVNNLDRDMQTCQWNGVQICAPSTEWMWTNLFTSCSSADGPIFVSSVEACLQCVNSHTWFAIIRPSTSTPWSDTKNERIMPFSFNLLNGSSAPDAQGNAVFIHPRSTLVITYEDNSLVVYERASISIDIPNVTLANRTVLTDLATSTCALLQNAVAVSSCEIFAVCANGIFAYTRSSAATSWSSGTVSLVSNLCQNLVESLIAWSASDIFVMCPIPLYDVNVVTFYLPSSDQPWSSSVTEVLTMLHGPQPCSDYFQANFAVASSFSVYFTCLYSNVLLNYRRTSTAANSWASGTVTSILPLTSAICSGPFGIAIMSSHASAVSALSQAVPAALSEEHLMLACKGNNTIVELYMYCTPGWARNFVTGRCECPAGFTCTSTTSLPTPCPPGSFSHCAFNAPSCNSLLECELCASGTYNLISAQANCSACEAGSYAASAGASTCSLCPQGHQCSNSQSSPVPCNAGSASSCSNTTSSTLSLTSCLITACTPCPLGSYQPASGAALCKLCPTGHYCDSSRTVAALCEPGTASQCPGVNASACTTPLTCPQCPKLTYAPSSGLATCLPCPSNTEVIGSSVCPVIPTTSLSSSSSFSLLSLISAVLGPIFAGFIGLLFWYWQRTREHAATRREFPLANALFITMHLSAYTNFKSTEGLRYVAFVQLVQAELNKELMMRNEQREKGSKKKNEDEIDEEIAVHASASLSSSSSVPPSSFHVISSSSIELFSQSSLMKTALSLSSVLSINGFHACTSSDVDGDPAAEFELDQRSQSACERCTSKTHACCCAKCPWSSCCKSTCAQERMLNVSALSKKDVLTMLAAQTVDIILKSTEDESQEHAHDDDVQLSVTPRASTDEFKDDLRASLLQERLP